MKTIELDVVATRGDEIESRHRVHAAIVGADDALIAASRDPRLVTSWRSCAKPFQVMPFSHRGLRRPALGRRPTRLSCASHGGEPEHVAIARPCSRHRLEEAICVRPARPAFGARHESAP
jgi:L-asparaginase II